MPHTSRWVIVLLIYADFRKSANVADPLSVTEQMMATLNSMFKDILTVPMDTTRARLYVVMNSIDYQSDDSLDTQSKTVLYEIGNPQHLKYNQIERCQVFDNSKGTQANPNPRRPLQHLEFLKTIICNKHMQVDEKEQVFFITWDHGSAFGIFREADMGVAHIRRPIYHDLDRYPYLAEFWNKAAKEVPDLKKLEQKEKAKSNSLPGLVQIRNTLFKVEVTSKRDHIRALDIPVKQTTIPVRNEEKLTSMQNLLLVFNGDSNMLEIVGDQHIGTESFLEEVARLTPQDVREILRNDELADVFKNWLGNDERKIGVLLMMNCWMMNLHTMYSLRETVNCLVAPQGDIGTPGYNYKDIFKYLFKSHLPSATPQQLAIKCVKTSENKRMRRRSKKLRADHEDMVDHWKIFAMDLQRKDPDGNLVLSIQLNALRLLICEINKRVRIDSSKSELRWMLKYIRSACFDFTVGDCMMIDFVAWCLSTLDIDKSFKDESRLGLELITPMNKFRDEVFKGQLTPYLVLLSTKAKKMYGLDTAIEPNAILKTTPTGYSLFFPLFSINTQANLGLLDNLKNDLLLTVCLNNWISFLKESIDEKIELGSGLI